MDNNKARRGFLKNFGIGSLVLAAEGYALSSETSRDAKPKKHLSMIFDQTKCVGCAECEDACHSVNLVPALQNRMVIQDRTDPEVPRKRRFVRVSCQQCEEAPCVAVCPTSACHRDSLLNIVTMNGDNCIGCAYCIVACPYDVRFINHKTNMAENCNFCLDTRLKKGLQPGCVDACKYDALVFGDTNDSKSKISRILNIKDTVRQRPELGTKPSLRYVPAVRQGV